MSIHESTTEPVASEEHEWRDTDEELPPRPRRRLLTPLPLTLLGVLLLACGFIAGVLVQKGQTSPSSPNAAGSAARLAAIARGSANGGGPAGASGTPGGRGATIGQVAFVNGHTLYVTTGEGATVKVSAEPGASITKTVKSAVKAIHPGETVVVTGASAANGAIQAESIRVGGSGGAGFFAAGRSLPSGQGGSAGGEEPALFGKG